jgi:hypothetical protein
VLCKTVLLITIPLIITIIRVLKIQAQMGKCSLQFVTISLIIRDEHQSKSEEPFKSAHD